MTITSCITGLGRLAATHELYAAGFTRRNLSTAVFNQDLIRVRQGWYALPDTTETLLQAARVGGRLACTSAARELGLSVRRSVSLHVSVVGNSVRLRSPLEKTIRLNQGHGVHVHWTDSVTIEGQDRLAVDARDCLRGMALCQSPERTVAAVDSAIRAGLLSHAQWEADIAGLPRRLRRLLRDVDTAAESITESVTRFRLHRLGIALRSQFRISGVGRVDFLIGERLVIEVDGWEYHRDRERFEDDRRRDAKLSMRGYRVLRFSYDQIFNRWGEVRAAIQAAIARGDCF